MRYQYTRLQIAVTLFHHITVERVVEQEIAGARVAISLNHDGR